MESQTPIRVLPELVEPKPVSPIVVKRVVQEKRIVKFDATQGAIREIRRRGYGLVRESPESGWCIIVVNRCYSFAEVLNWMINLQSEEVRDEAEEI